MILIKILIKAFIAGALLLMIAGKPALAEGQPACTMDMAEMKEIQGLKWLTSLQEGLARAKKENKLVLVDFCANWCAACKELDMHTYTDKKVISEVNSRFIPVRLDISELPEGKELIRKYNIEELPLVIFFDKNNKLIDTHMIAGFTKADKFLQVLKQVKEER